MPQPTIATSAPIEPRLELYPVDGGAPQRIMLDRMPFIVGRGRSADFQIDSAKVSREHCKFERRGESIEIRDLGSTNGTFHNGNRVDEAVLADGDTLVIADTEVTFFASGASRFERMATQPIRARAEEAPADVKLGQEVAALRAVQEAVMWQAMPVSWRQIEWLADGGVFARWATLGAGPSIPAAPPEPPNTPESRRRELYRLRAAETLPDLGGAPRLFVEAALWEVQASRTLLDALDRVRNSLPRGAELGVVLPAAAVTDVPMVADFCRRARERELLLAYSRFVGADAHVVTLEEAAPDLLILGDEMTNSLESGEREQRRLQGVLSACQQMNIRAVVNASDEEALSVSRKLGCELAARLSRPRARISPSQLRRPSCAAG